jgi:ribosome-binding protein aMBF1 (putative translation factor)
MDSVLDYSFGPGFDQLGEELLKTPEDREEYERSVRTMVMIRKLLMAIDAEREHRGMSKADLARLAGTNESAIRRLFADERANPTLRTVLGLLAVLRIEWEFKLPSSSVEAAADPKASPKASKPRRSMANSKPGKREAA